MSTDFSLRQLRYFVAIAEAGALSKAASRLHVSQPGLSQALTDLERALDVQLAVRRKAHGVTLTPAGAEVLRMARELLHRADDLGQLAAGGQALTGTLALGCYETLGPTVLPPLLEAFSVLHPGVRIHLVEGTQDRLQRDLHSGALDLAILYDMEMDPELANIAITSTRPHLLLGAEHRLADRGTLALREVAEEPLVLLDAPPSSHNTLRIFESNGVTPRIAFRPSTFELARALVGRNLGYALLVQRPANDRTYEGRRVVITEIEDSVPLARTLIAWPQSIRLNRRAQEFARVAQTMSIGPA